MLFVFVICRFLCDVVCCCLVFVFLFFVCVPLCLLRGYVYRSLFVLCYMCPPLCFLFAFRCVVDACYCMLYLLSLPVNRWCVLFDACRFCFSFVVKRCRLRFVVVVCCRGCVLLFVVVCLLVVVFARLLSFCFKK